ncbi:hypothetical protein [Inconstantimicrobium mannanitabidum]|uniref:Uncharacterized protein n=1 Tax=Inconstantimicrobium mannanitabidum TaxID=1604901 RepID=A0ACB5R7R2_9CLOT|nr:hypothetical protein [Clostridium sp. TW13]GKX65202.1 hypothetical protein rsdtw13_04600 [Clostridium sp. TW13]
MNREKIAQLKKEILNGNYGVINDPKLFLMINSLINKNGNLMLEEYTEQGRKKYINILKVVNTLCYKISDSIETLSEFNPTLKMECSKNSFWSVNETEYKIDVYPTDKFSFSKFNAMFENVNIENFETGAIQCTNSFERYLELQSDNIKDYLVLLGKKGWSKKPAIKFKEKEEGEILTRRVKILELNKENLIESIEQITKENYKNVQIDKLPPFYKRKDRVVCIDQKRGYVFGVSYSEAKTATKDSSMFNQIEVEFWSKLISGNANPNIDWEDVNISHKELIKAIEKTLVKENFKYRAPGGRKYDWLSQLGKSNKGVKLEQII